MATGADWLVEQSFAHLGGTGCDRFTAERRAFPDEQLGVHTTDEACVAVELLRWRFWEIRSRGNLECAKKRMFLRGNVASDRAKPDGELS